MGHEGAPTGPWGEFPLGGTAQSAKGARMSLATRCSVCGTVFRVVQDQLKVSEGWVRCGRCEQVFNALEGLFDLEREAPPPWPPDGAPASLQDRKSTRLNSSHG